MNLNQPVSRRTFILALALVAAAGLLAIALQTSTGVSVPMSHISITNVLAGVVLVALGLTPLSLLNTWRNREVIRARADKDRERRRMQDQHRGR